MSAIKLIIGLANPGDRYALTRHNAGEWFIKLLAGHQPWRLESSLSSRIIKQINPPMFLSIPTTYMNNSGIAVRAVSQYFKIAPEEILIAHDEIDLPTGTIRLKQDGGHGGHNGLRSIIQQLSTANFWRLRIGVGRPQQASQVEHYVLNAPTKDEQALIDAALEKAHEIFPLILQGKFQQAMNFLHT